MQHLFFACSGLLVSWWSIGEDALFHSLATISVTYIAVRLLGATRATVAMVFAFNLAYLLAGYWMRGAEEYDFSWTIPQCMLCLKMIGECVELN